MSSPADTGTLKVENEGAFTRFLRATEIDARLLGMIAALVVIWVGFHVYGQVVNNFGAFLTPRNLWNLSVADGLGRGHGHGHGSGDCHPPY